MATTKPSSTDVAGTSTLEAPLDDLTLRRALGQVRFVEDSDERDDDDVDEYDEDDDEDDSTSHGRNLKRQRGKKKKPTPSPVALRESDLHVWQRFHVDLMGQKWRSCNSFSNPCNQGPKCRDKVKCKRINDELRIVAIVLPNNRLNGVVPGRELAELDELKVLDLSNKPGKGDKNQLRPALPCFELTRCLDESLTCKFGRTDLLADGVEYCSDTTRELHVNDLVIWQQFFSLTNGTGWNTCSDSYDDPCGCSADNDHYVLCEFIGNDLRITAVILADNNLKGTLATATQNLHGWTEVRELDLSDNPGLKGCVGWRECDAAAVDEANTERQCDVAGTQLQVCDGISGSGDDDGSIPGTVDPMRLEALDRAVWEQLYDALNGQFWRRCSGSRANPCAFPRCVVCGSSPANPLKRTIVEIKLEDNNLSGELPLQALFQLNNTLQYFDAFSTDPSNETTRNIFTNADDVNSCLLLPIRWNLTGSGLDVCPLTPEQLMEIDEDSDGLFATQVDFSLNDDNSDDQDSFEVAVDPAGDYYNADQDDDDDDDGSAGRQRWADVTAPVHLGDLAAYQAFYRGLHGESWIHCAETFSDPCVGCEDDAAARVMCMVETDRTTGNQVLRITEISLEDNHLQGVLDVSAVNVLSRLAILDLANTPIAVKTAAIRNEVDMSPENKCLNLDVCRRGDTFCNLSGLARVELCA